MIRFLKVLIPCAILYTAFYASKVINKASVESGRSPSSEIEEGRLSKYKKVFSWPIGSQVMIPKVVKVKTRRSDPNVLFLNLNDNKYCFKKGEGEYTFYGIVDEDVSAYYNYCSTFKKLGSKVIEVFEKTEFYFESDNESLLERIDVVKVFRK